MRLTKLQLHGFKSFADPTDMRFETGVTAIVGPNGCGKSNILDALRWSLGEQSPRTLRGTHMQDVIFNGSENRQPMGMAEVSVTFDNSDSRLPVDFAEVTRFSPSSTMYTRSAIEKPSRSIAWTALP